MTSFFQEEKKIQEKTKIKKIKKNKKRLSTALRINPCATGLFTTKLGLGGVHWTPK